MKSSGEGLSPHPLPAPCLRHCLLGFLRKPAKNEVKWLGGLNLNPLPAPCLRHCFYWMLERFFFPFKTTISFNRSFLCFKRAFRNKMKTLLIMQFSVTTFSKNFQKHPPPPKQKTLSKGSSLEVHVYRVLDEMFAKLQICTPPSTNKKKRYTHSLPNLRIEGAIVTPILKMKTLGKNVIYTSVL